MIDLNRFTISTGTSIYTKNTFLKIYFPAENWEPLVVWYDYVVMPLINLN